MKAKENNNNFLTAGILAAIGASLCCITPVLAITAGISGAASVFSWLDPFRPYLIAATVLLLGFAWYGQLKSQKEDVACACEDEEDKNPFLHSKKFLSIITLLSVLLIAFPYYSSVFFSQPAKASASFVKQSVFDEVRLDIEGMTCAGCENSVNHILNSKEGVVETKADYESGTAKVIYDPTVVSPETFKAIIEDEIGYQVTNISIDSSNAY